MSREDNIIDFLYSLDTTRFKEKEYREWVSSKLPKYFKWTLAISMVIYDEDCESNGGYKEFKKNIKLNLQIKDDILVSIRGIVYRGVPVFSSELPTGINDNKEIHINLQDFGNSSSGSLYTYYALFDSRHFIPQFKAIRKLDNSYYNFKTKFYLKDNELSDILFPVVMSPVYTDCSPKDFFYAVYYDFSKTVFKNPLSLSKLKLGEVNSTEEMFKGCVFPVDFSFGEWATKHQVSDLDEETYYRYCVSMFEGCTFPDNFSLNLPVGLINYYNDRMFARCKFGKHFRFVPHFLNFNEDDDRKEFFCGSTIPEDFSLESQFVTTVWRGNDISDYVYLGSDSTKYSKMKDVFKDCTFLGGLEPVVSKIIRNASLSPERKDLEIANILIANNECELSGVNTCAQELMELIKGNNSLQECIYVLSSEGKYSKNQVERGYYKIYKFLFNKCLKSVPKYLFKSSDNGNSVTVGQARDLLVAKGYPKGIVESAIIEYLKDQILV